MPDVTANILEIMKIKDARRQERIRNTIAQQQVYQQGERDKATEENRQKQLDLQVKAHEDLTKHQEAILKATQAVHKLTSLKELQAFGDKYQGGAPAPAGVNVLPGNDENHDTLQYPMESNQQVPGIIGEIPLPFTNQPVLKPAVYAKQQADYNEALEVPKRETIRLTKQADEERQAARDAATADRMAAHDLQNAKALEERQTRQLKSMEFIAQGHDNARIAATELTHAGLGDFDPTPLVEDVLSGRKSDKDVLMNVQDKRKAAAVFAAVKNAGGAAINEKQKEYLGQFRPAFVAVQKMDEFNDIMTKNPVRARLDPTSEEFKRVRTLQEQIKEAVIQATTAMGQRQSDIRAKAAMNAYGTSTNALLGSTTNNKKIRNDYNKLMLDTFYDKFSNLPDKQRQHFVSVLENEARPDGGQPQLQEVKMKKPDGTVVLVHAEDVEKAKAANYQQVP